MKKHIKRKYIDADKLIAEIDRKMKCWEGDGLPKGIDSPYCTLKGIRKYVETLQQEQSPFPTIKGWIARDDADRLGLYDQKPTRKTELGAFSGIIHSWVIGDTWIGRFSLDKTAKPLFPNICWTNDPIEVELTIKPIQEQSEKEE